MKIVGIDYSLTSPAITVYEGNECTLDNVSFYDHCTFHYFVSKPKLMKTDEEQFKCTLYPEYENDAHRYNNLSEWAMKIISGSDIIFTEGYSFGSVGRTFNIAENGGVLKHKIWKAEIPSKLFAPSEIKKFATGKGTSNKQMMYDAFLAETGINIREKIGIEKETIWNPLSDIIDSYYITKLGAQSSLHLN